MGRRRLRLVPDDGVEIFEARIVLYFDSNGERQVQAIVSTPDEPDLEVIDMVELEGALARGVLELREAYDGPAT